MSEGSLYLILYLKKVVTTVKRKFKRIYFYLPGPGPSEPIPLKLLPWSNEYVMPSFVYFYRGSVTWTTSCTRNLFSFIFQNRQRWPHFSVASVCQSLVSQYHLSYLWQMAESEWVSLHWEEVFDKHLGSPSTLCTRWLFERSCCCLEEYTCFSLASCTTSTFTQCTHYVVAQNPDTQNIGQQFFWAYRGEKGL